MGKTLDGCLRAATITAHPRSRGENQLLVGQRPVLAGSSPLTRGKRKSVGSRRYQEGLIPAHAGKTATRPPPPSSPTAHPRSRGENTAILPRGTVVRGSSPLTWGKLEGLAVLGDCLGLIPAHVGKTLGGCLRAATITAHPRSRGENAPRRVSHSTHRGLIPEIARLGRTLRKWKGAFLAYFDTGGASNGPTEAINGIIELGRRTARGYRNPTNYRLRMLLIAGGLDASAHTQL